MSVFSRIARAACRFTGHPATFFGAVMVVVVWAVTGPYFGYSDTWQLIINTGTTILTFLMVFLLQNGQNRDICAIHVKLDELIRAVKEARNSVMDLENLDDAQLAKLLVEYRNLAGSDMGSTNLGASDMTRSAEAAVAVATAAGSRSTAPGAARQSNLNQPVG